MAQRSPRALATSGAGTASAATFNVPSRAGEASTMTGGAPNMVTDNSRVIMQSDHPVVIVD